MFTSLILAISILFSSSSTASGTTNDYTVVWGQAVIVRSTTN
jgi:hypothetical protein